jgi:hypothetical protein
VVVWQPLAKRWVSGNPNGGCLATLQTETVGVWQPDPLQTVGVWQPQPSADFGPTFAVAAPVEAPRRLHVRASNQGFLPDWTGRELRADKRGMIPDHLAPIMERLGLNRLNWVETVRGFGRLFKQAAGRSSSLVDAAARRSRCWFQGKAAARTAFV